MSSFSLYVVGMCLLLIYTITISILCVSQEEFTLIELYFSNFPSFSTINCAISHDNCTQKASVKVKKVAFYIRYKICPILKTNLKIQMQYNSIFSNHRLKTWIQCNGIFQTTTNIGKTRDKYCLLSFMHRSKKGLLIPFAKINKRGGLNKERGGGEKI